MKRKGREDFVIPDYLCGVKYMVRYMDDIVCFGANKRELKTALERIESYCSGKLGLEIKKNKQIFPLSKEIPLTEKELAERKREKKSIKKESERDRARAGFYGIFIQTDADDDQKSDIVPDHAQGAESCKERKGQLVRRFKHYQPHGVL